MEKIKKLSIRNKLNKRCCLLFLIIYSLNSYSQGFKNGEIHGNFQTDAQYYNPDSSIGAPAVPEKMLFNGFINTNYISDNFSAGLRYENYANTLQGLDKRYNGSGIPYRYITYRNEEIEVTGGSFYEQFGSGLIFRSYEERNLGYDNAIDGFRIKFNPYKGAYLKGIVGRQRNFFSLGPGIVRGIDGEFQINELFSNLSEKQTKITVGGSFISKYQKDDDPIYNLPQNVAAGGGRMNIIRKDISIYTEYVYKVNDPSSVNKYIYKPGEALYISTAYSKKGLGITLSGKRIDNMNFRSDRTAVLNSLLINYLPALTKQHTYSLLAFYPYASQPNGEVSFQGEIFYKIKKDTKLGGIYGVDITLNYSQSNGLDTINLNDGNADLIMGYKSNYWSFGRNYFKDLNIEINKKFTNKLKSTFIYANQFYDKNIIQGLSGYESILSNIIVIDMTYKANSDNVIRLEFQNLSTKQDNGNWAYAGLEYTVGSHWFFAVLDQYNYGNKDSSKKIHYLLGSLGYTKKSTRVALGYGKQRSGIFCVGGVCRLVPASNGLSLSITSSF